MNQKNKTILITGASRGLGFEIANQALKQGFNLILVARSIPTTAFTKIHSQQTIDFFSVNLADPKEVEIFSEKCKEKQIDILINNAAIQGPMGPLWENDWQAYQMTLQVDLLSPIFLCRAIILQMIKRKKGKIINLAGGGATSARPNFSAYAVAKTGLVRFTETLAEEVKPFHIDVNAVSPGVMHTTMIQEMLDAGPEKIGETAYQQLLKKIESGDDSLEKAVRLCLFLASEDSDGITGKLISAVWDPWEDKEKLNEILKNSDNYTLRRITS